MKVETHNHPTAISPFPGASTGAGGEIRDEGATGRGAKPKAGLTGFTVSNLMLPARELGAPLRPGPDAHRQPAADHDRGPARRRRLQQRIRPARTCCGYFRNTSRRSASDRRRARQRGYHKPIMIAGGLGNIDGRQTKKIRLPGRHAC